MELIEDDGSPVWWVGILLLLFVGAAIGLPLLGIGALLDACGVVAP